MTYRSSKYSLTIDRTYAWRKTRFIQIIVTNCNSFSGT